MPCQGRPPERRQQRWQHSDRTPYERIKWRQLLVPTLRTDWCQPTSGYELSDWEQQSGCLEEVLNLSKIDRKRKWSRDDSFVPTYVPCSLSENACENERRKTVCEMWTQMQESRVWCSNLKLNRQYSFPFVNWMNLRKTRDLLEL